MDTVPALHSFSIDSYHFSSSVAIQSFHGDLTKNMLHFEKGAYVLYVNLKNDYSSSSGEFLWLWGVTIDGSQG